MNFEMIIGFEVYVEFKIKFKIFLVSLNVFGVVLNVNISVIDLGYFGVLFVLNKEVVDFVMKVVFVLNCEIVIDIKFDCKNYFYLDNLKVY